MDKSINMYTSRQDVLTGRRHNVDWAQSKGRIMVPPGSEA